MAGGPISLRPYHFLYLVTKKNDPMDQPQGIYLTIPAGEQYILVRLNGETVMIDELPADQARKVQELHARTVTSKHIEPKIHLGGFDDRQDVFGFYTSHFESIEENQLCDPFLSYFWLKESWFNRTKVPTSSLSYSKFFAGCNLIEKAVFEDRVRDNSWQELISPACFVYTDRTDLLERELRRHHTKPVPQMKNVNKFSFPYMVIKIFNQMRLLATDLQITMIRMIVFCELQHLASSKSRPFDVDEFEKVSNACLHLRMEDLDYISTFIEDETAESRTKIFGRSSGLLKGLFKLPVLREDRKLKQSLDRLELDRLLLDLSATKYIADILGRGGIPKADPGDQARYKELIDRTHLSLEIVEGLAKV